MKLVRPFLIDDASLTSTSVVETVDEYDAGDTYGLGDQALDDTNHRIMESLQAGNIGHPLTDPAWWADAGPSNPWAMFDTVNGTQTSDTETIEVIVAVTGFADTVALLNISANTVQITVDTDDDGTIYDETFSLVSTEEITDWYAYFFEEVALQTDLIVQGLPNYGDPSITVQLIGGDPYAVVSCGTMIVGRAREIGDTQYGASLGMLSRSKKESDEFGNYTVVRRPFSKTGEFTVNINGGSVTSIASKVAAVQRLLESYETVPILWIGSDEYTATAIFGFYRSFSNVISYPLTTVCNLTIEGLS